MSQIKNMWLSGLTFEYGVWFCNNDNRSGSSTCVDQYRIQDHGDGGRQTLFGTGAGTVGDGLNTAMGPGLVWNVGPYTFRAMGSFSEGEDRGGTPGKKRAHNFLIGHDLFLWSPKGFLTGSATETGSVLIGTHFERVDISCGDRTRPCSGGVSGSSGNNFRRDRILLREWDLWYFIAPRMSVGANFLWYDASNLKNTFNSAGNNLGLCTRTPASATTTNCRAGFGGDWLDVMLNWRYTF